jgi:hypothetical protein
VLILAPSVRVFVARASVDFRRGIEGLCDIVRESFVVGHQTCPPFGQET